MRSLRQTPMCLSNELWNRFKNLTDFEATYSQIWFRAAESIHNMNGKNLYRSNVKKTLDLRLNSARFRSRPSWIYELRKLLFRRHQWFTLLRDFLKSSVGQGLESASFLTFALFDHQVLLWVILSQLPYLLKEWPYQEFTVSIQNSEGAPFTPPCSPFQLAPWKLSYGAHTRSHSLPRIVKM